MPRKPLSTTLFPIVAAVMFLCLFPGCRYSYQRAPNDPLGARLYTLSNGLKVYLVRKPDEAKVQTLIAVNAGSTYEPGDNTGLAHYLEHMLFKGTSRLGSLDWEQEEPLLKEISTLYERHRQETDPQERQAIYAEIDKVSQAASVYAIAGEYDNLIASLGGGGTNAFTSLECTVYINTIPANEIERWLKIERERFGELAPRLFHTELETVYEEFNRALGSDSRRAHAALNKLLFPNHPYGRAVIGKAEHLKSPSVKAIHRYFDTYYVPENMALIMAGDLAYDQTIAQIDATLGTLPAREGDLPGPFAKEDPITQVATQEVMGPSSDLLYFAYRFGGWQSQDEPYVTLIDMLLNNSAAGLIDLNLVKDKRIQTGGCYPSFNRDYGAHTFWGRPKKGQTLEEVKDLLRGEIEKIKEGQFEEWLIEAVIKDLERSYLELASDYKGIASLLLDIFVLGRTREETLMRFDALRKITKTDLVRFANQHYRDDNYVVVFKRQGDPELAEVEKPQITPVSLNREDQSSFAREIGERPPEPLTPVLVDFATAIDVEEVAAGIPLESIPNEETDLFSLVFLFEIGDYHEAKLGLALRYLKEIGTETYSPQKLSEEFYKAGVTFSPSVSNEQTFITLSGHEEDLERGVELLASRFSDPRLDEEIYQKIVASILQSRENAKKSKGSILSALYYHGKHGPNTPLRDGLSEASLQKIHPEELLDLVKELFSYEHRVFYYGDHPEKVKEAYLRFFGPSSSPLKQYPHAPKSYKEKETEKVVYFTPYDIVQTEIRQISKIAPYSPDLAADIAIFNTFFGSGLSSIVFQEIRESRALAYAASARFRIPSYQEDSHYLTLSLGTQSDKLPEAIATMKDLLSQDLPEAPLQFESAKQTLLKQIASERFVKAQPFWLRENLRLLGIDRDTRGELYEKIQNYTFEDAERFFDTYIKGRTYTTLMVGKRSLIDFEALKLKELGPIEEMDVETLFQREG